MSFQRRSAREWLAELYGADVMRLGTPTGNYLNWDGSVLALSGALVGATIADHSLTFAKLPTVASQTVLGRSAGGTGDVSALTTLPNTIMDNITRLGTIATGTWSATVIGLAFGGTAASLSAVTGGIVYSGASALAISAAGSAGQILRSAAAAPPTWSTATYPSTATTAGAYLRADGTNWITSTLLLPNAATFGQVVYATALNTWGASANLTFSGSALALTGDETVSGFVGATTYASQTTGWRIDSTGGADFRYLFVDEMHAKSFITDLEMALVGGQIIAKSVAMVAVAFVCPAYNGTQTLWVRDIPSMADTQAFVSGDTVVVRTFSRAGGTMTIADCIGVVTSYADQANGLQTWTFTRNNSTNGGTAGTPTIAVDSLAIDYGVSTNGYYEVNADDGNYGANSPYAQIVTWTTAPIPANKVVRTRFGNLVGITGTSGEYGMIAGTYAGTNGSYFRASNSVFELHGITAKWWDATTNVAIISPGSGSPYFSLGNPAPTSYGANAGVFLGWDHAATKAKASFYADANNYLQYDGAKLTWKAANTTLDSSGNLTAASATLSGAITATSGLISGDMVIGSGGDIRSGATAFGTTTGWWLDYNSGTPRFRVGNPSGNRLSWDGTNVTIVSGKLIVDGSGNGHVSIGGGILSAGTLNLASDNNAVTSYALICSGNSANVSLTCYGDGTVNLGPLFMLPGLWDTTGAGSNPGMQANGPFGIAQPTGWFLVYIYTGSTYEAKWLPAY